MKNVEWDAITLGRSETRKNSEANRAAVIELVLERSTVPLTREQVGAVVDVFKTFTEAGTPFMPFGNRFGVGVMGEQLAIVGLARSIPRDAALNLGTWLLVLGDFTDEEIAEERRKALGGE